MQVSGFSRGTGCSHRDCDHREIHSRAARDLLLPLVARSPSGSAHFLPSFGGGADPASGTVPPVSRSTRNRLLGAIGLVLIAMLTLAPGALAADGVGLGGRTTDKSVTFFCFGVIALFMILPIVLSLIQARLEGRKERMREQLERVRRP
jgi:hypothetical protein